MVFRSTGIPAACISGHTYTLAFAPALPWHAKAVGEVEGDLLFAAIGEEVLGAKPDNSIGTLLQVLATGAYVQNSGMYILPHLGLSVVQQHRIPMWLQGQVAEVMGMGSSTDDGPCGAGRCRKAFV